MNNGCPFCDVKQLEERIIAEIDEFRIVATLGQITDGGYLLLIPVKHVSCLGEFSREQTSKMLKIVQEVNKILTVEYNIEQSIQSAWPITLFEHGIVGQTVKHAHLHFLPTVVDLTVRIKTDFPNSKVEELEYAAHLPNLYSKDPKPYLYWTAGQEGNTKGRVCWDPPAPPQYLRIITADALGRPERANWSEMDPELDKKLGSETVQRLRHYFI